MPALDEQPALRCAVVSTDVARVWERLWQHAPTDAKDDRLLLRERRSPRYERVVSFLEAAFGTLRGLRTIEMGSGRGDLSALLAQRGADVTLLDASRSGLGQARRRFERLGLEGEFTRADLLALPESMSGQFDVAFSTGVIEHFRGTRRGRAMDAHAAVVRPGGAVVVSVPNAHCLPYRLWKLYLELRGWWPYGTEVPYSRRELAHHARRAGLVIEEIAGVGFWQSVGDHWVRGVLHREADWVDRRSALDHALGMSVVLLARKRGKPACPPARGATIERHFVRRGSGCEFEMEAAWVRAEMPRGSGRVADLGCGGGHLFDVVGRHRVIGMDHEPVGLQHTRSSAAPVPLICASADRVPLADSAVDAITLQHVIEHLPSAESAAAEWSRVLAPSGSLLILTPNADFVSPAIFDDPTHVRLFRPRELASLLTAAGFEVADLRTLGLPWFRDYARIPGGWRLRQFVTRWAGLLSRIPGLRWSGQTLCCVARRRPQ